MLQEIRHTQIESFLLKQKAAKASELAAILDVSIDTVRRDLEMLEKKGIVKRVHGGAVLKQKENNVLNKLFEEREVANLQEKQSIASFAVELIEEGQAIALNGGTTTAELAKVIVNKFQRLTIITNDLRIVSILSTNKQFNIILTGGFYNSEEFTLYGPQCEAVLSNLNIDTAFITVNGLSIQDGLTDFRIHEVGVIQTILARTKNKIVIADTSKFETSSLMTICPLQDIDMVITDYHIPQELIDQYNNHQIRVLHSNES
ncbi:DeoR/GlpR family DNA-binding transcription regulator [Lysinibacillus sp. LZ02]|uniref:DeoR/GlpR family DNA-binding transcription regulator n=1 Tax=Lysinibacillus sp. LZ02 TaxID=3420668 RepID=UPI003D368473